ncbi:4-alpha-glucanotransferase [Stenotrophomonas sp. C3(2023)]|uniref:4-alpha-glucanotransferase n=1 Tax=Stenotrophomonas sp. C3(2023) TaxID=3080277 RepID=UPI00293CD653|nr:4-alpha-glucanotransferase [Stenotrophomonas sp. C3(2023)]MDV3468600.1 4-alpha-glucanotransferase [Stenotrophomonas sp. C3(2023)]
MSPGTLELRDLHACARAAGLQVHWEDVSGAPRTVEPEVLRAVLDSLGPRAAAPTSAALQTGIIGQTVAIAGSSRSAAVWCDEAGRQSPASCNADGHWLLPGTPGYWQWQQGERKQPVAVAPQRAWHFEEAAARCWGLAVQSYSLRGNADGGIGDSSGAAAWLGAMAAQGGVALALSPMHLAMGFGDGFSPYSPSDRAALEPVHAAPAQVLPEAAAATRAADPDLDARLAHHEAQSLIDWPSAARTKREWIDRLPAWLQAHQPDLWQTIAAQLGSGCMALDDARQAFAQWLVRHSWQQVQQRAVGEGMAVGLIADLAVGFDPHGQEAQRNGDAVLRGLELGAPPDAFNPHGQAWGITGYAPHALRASGYAPYIALLRAVMADRGGVRIDHILGLQRLWVLPQGAGAGQGVYLRYPFDDLLNLLVLESSRHRCVVIGEDLGVVPAGIRDALATRGVLGMDVLPFARDDAGFWPPQRWRRSAVAMTSTHDLPPLAGWLDRSDLDIRQQLGWLDAAQAEAAHTQRTLEIDQLRAATDDWAAEAASLDERALQLVARSPSPLALLPLEDALGERAQPNLPGTVHEHPNWRRRLPPPGDADVEHRLATFAAARTLKDPA